jgi:hypothetical protein
MLKAIFSKVMWLGKATTFLIGLAVMLALVFGVATMALAGTGVGARFDLGKTNTVNAISRLVGSVAGPNLLIDNNSTNSSATALDLQVESGKPPLKVNSEKKVAKLNADKLDDIDSSELAPRGYAQVSHSGPTLVPGSFKGVIDVQRPTTGLYCFDLSFTPKAAVASGHINNNATVGTILGSSVPSACTGEFRDAAARTYAANTSAAQDDLSFGIVFM